MTIFDALIANTPGKSMPDSHDFDLGKPNPEFVVSRDLAGNVLSRYGDLTWDRTPYSAGMVTNLHFQFWKQGEITERRLKLLDEIRWIMFLMIWHHPARKALSTKTLNACLIAIRAIAREADSIEMSLEDAFSNHQFLASTPDARSNYALKVLLLLQYLGPELTGFKVCNAGLECLRVAAARYANDIKQTAPIPTRIYSAILHALDLEVDLLGTLVERIAEMYIEIKSTPGAGIATGRQKKLCLSSAAPTFDELLQKLGLTQVWSEFGAINNIQGLSGVISEIQCTLALQIQAYTGMRAEEVKFLPFHCLEEAKRDGDSRVHFIVKGTVTKLSGGKELRANWITIEVAAKAIRTSQVLSRAIYAGHGLLPGESRKRKAGALLFPRADCDGKKIRKALPWQKPTHLAITERLRSKLCPTIQSDDLDELYAIDPNRQWSLEDAFKVGGQWHLRTHQLRRSLALYAQSSGLVSLPSLKRQLQHLTYEMSLYYAKGSAFANDFIGDSRTSKDRHFGEEWRETQSVSQYLAYAASILLTDQSNLFGGHGQWLRVHQADSEGKIFINRQETMKSFQRGEIAFRPTPLGGCVSTSRCERTPINVLSLECLGNDCKNLLANSKKIERIISVKRNKIGRLMQVDSQMAEVRIEEAELKILESALRRAHA